MKLTKEDIDKVRHIEGFPIARTRILLLCPILPTIRHALTRLLRIL
jgi:hypothetical protein